MKAANNRCRSGLLTNQRPTGTRLELALLALLPLSLSCARVENPENQDTQTQAETVHKPLEGDALQPTIAASDIWVLKVVDCTWEKQAQKVILDSGAVHVRIPGDLSVEVTQVLRGKAATKGEARKITIWKDTIPFTFGEGTSPWRYLPLGKESEWDPPSSNNELVFFLAPKVRDYDRWSCAIGSLRVINVYPCSEALLRDLALIKKVMQAKDPEKVVLDALAKPDTWGDDFAHFLCEWTFRHKKLALQLTIIEECSSNQIPAKRREILVDTIMVYLRHNPPWAEIQLLTDVCTFNLLDKEMRELRGDPLRLVNGLYDLLVRQGHDAHVKINAADLPQLIHIVRSSSSQYNEQVATALEKMAERAK